MLADHAVGKAGSQSLSEEADNASSKTGSGSEEAKRNRGAARPGLRKVP